MPAAFVYDPLPPRARFRLRQPVLSTVGRLDRDTSGLLLFTDDGQLLHLDHLAEGEAAQVYVATLAEDLRGDEAALFASGTLLLEGEKALLLPAELEVLGARSARLTLHEGRYHQVRRMFAAVGNHVVALHRERIGGWRWTDCRPASGGSWATATGRTLRGRSGRRIGRDGGTVRQFPLGARMRIEQGAVRTQRPRTSRSP